MRRFCAIITLCCAMLAVTTSAGAEELDARAIVRQIETQYQGETSRSKAVMTVVTQHWTRELVMEMWSEGRDKFLAKILSPKKEQGTASLKIGDEMWNYLPKIDRLIKIPSSLMGDSWMGSHFTNDDLVKEDKVDELYDLSIASRDGDRVVITGIPKSDAAVVWGRIDYTVDMEKVIPVEILYYDEDGELVRRFTFDRVEQVSGRWLPLHMVIQPLDKPEEKTEFVYDSIEFNVKLDNDFFSLRSLRR